MLEIKHIKKSYKTGDFVQKALNDVSIQFRQNEFVAILGPSGSGKTTLFKCFGRIRSLRFRRFNYQWKIDQKL